MECNQIYGEDNYIHIIPGLIYITTSFHGTGVNMDLHNFLPKGCRCIGSCQKEICSCFLRYNKQQPLSTDDFCIDTHSALGPITECNDDCKCEKKCFNRTVQNGPRLGLEIVDLGAKGFGLVTKSIIPKGSFVCEYAGEIIGIKEAGIRFELASASNSNYILILREHSGAEVTNITIIDPTVIGNIGRYINHSCQPNTVVIPVRINSIIPVAALFASRTIQVGEEICYDYDACSGSAEMLYPLNFDTLHSSSSTLGVAENCDLKNSLLSNVETVPVRELFLSSSNQQSDSKRPCLCLSQNCRQFLPSNSNLFT